MGRRKVGAPPGGTWRQSLEEVFPGTKKKTI